MLKHQVLEAQEAFDHRMDPLKGHKLGLLGYSIFLLVFQLASFGAFPTAALFDQNEAVAELFAPPDGDDAAVAESQKAAPLEQQRSTPSPPSMWW